VVNKSGDLVVFEVNGSQDPLYCSRLCLLAKLFLKEKVAYKRLSGFLFYVAYTVNATGGSQFVGYFLRYTLTHSLLIYSKVRSSGGDLAPSLGGRFFRKKIRFSRRKFLMTFFSHRPDFSDFAFLFPDIAYL